MCEIGVIDFQVGGNIGKTQLVQIYRQTRKSCSEKCVRVYHPAKSGALIPQVVA